jgi:hypothetical protein
MGCICSGESNIENFLTEFINDLRIRKYNENNFFAYLDKNCPYESLVKNFDEFLQSNQNEEIHNNYKSLLFQRKNHLFYSSLIFLIQSDPENISINYRKIIENMKNSHKENKLEFLEDFFKNDFEILFDVLSFYVRMISYDIIEALEKTNDNRMSEEQIKYLKKSYDVKVIEIFVKNILKDLNNSINGNLNLENFFSKNYKNLNHVIIREKLKVIYENFDLYLRDSNNLNLKTKEEKENVKILLSSDLNQNQNPHYDEEIVECQEKEEINKEKEALKLKQYNDFRKKCLFHHNEIRDLHCVPHLKESDSLSEYSQLWAEFIAENDNLTHSSMNWEGKFVGENIAKAGAIITDPSELIVCKWYEEKQNYDFLNHSSINSTKNFTQMVWKDTEAIGFGLAFSESGNTFIVINYFPAGNIFGKYKDNVNPSRY